MGSRFQNQISTKNDPQMLSSGRSLGPSQGTQMGPKMTPGGPQEGPKRPPGVAQRLQNSTKNCQKRLKNAFETLRFYA